MKSGQIFVRYFDCHAYTHFGGVFNGFGSKAINLSVSGNPDLLVCFLYKIKVKKSTVNVNDNMPFDTFRCMFLAQVTLLRGLASQCMMGTI